MKTVAIVQARTGSTRLPRKVLADIGGEVMLGRVLSRLRRAATLDEVRVATTVDADDDAIADWCAARGVPVTRGPEEDVLLRYLLAARDSGADVLVRITSDCPLIDPAIVDAIVRLRAETHADYAGNTVLRTYPDGLDAEAFTLDALRRADVAVTEGFDRLHATSYIYRNPHMFRLANLAAPINREEVRWTVDTADDLALVRRIYAAFGNRDDFGWEQALALYDSDPALVAINSHIRPKAIEEG